MPKKDTLGFEQVKRIYRQLITRRAKALREEVAFWDKWLATKGLEWPSEYIDRQNPDLEFQPHLRRYIENIPDNPVHILDVGSGPLTTLGKKIGSRNIEITATDLLAPYYDQILDKHAIAPCVRTTFADVENLTSKFSNNIFSMVYAKNCIDHTKNPLKAIGQMVAVVKESHFVVLEHAENEAENHNYIQLHQWNFTKEENDFVIWRPGMKINVTKELRDFGEIETVVSNGWLQVAIKKYRK